MLPELEDLRAGAHVVSLPMRERFRGIDRREVLLLRGPAGWGEFAPFPEYGDDEAKWWLASAVESAWTGPPAAVRSTVPVNATVPAVESGQVPDILARFPGVTTAKVKVAEPGQSLDDDVARVRAVRELVPHVRVDANGGWTVEQAEHALGVLTAEGELQYAEQPCRTVDELVELRRRLPEVRIAADESIRRADDPLRVVRAGGADVAVVKVAPLGGMRRLLTLAGELGVPVVVSSALDSAVGMGAGLAAAAALPTLDLACGLGTGELLARDVAAPRRIVAGALEVAALEPEESLLEELSAEPVRRRWWLDRLERCHAELQAVGHGA